MSNLPTSAIESALMNNDLSNLTIDQRLNYYNNVCESLGLNKLTQPFSYIKLNGKLTLYAKRDATDQLRKVHNVSVVITSREKTDGLYIVSAKATMPDGRTDESLGVVSIEGLKGDALANALLKSETKAKRRVTLSICGLGFSDETEVETIPDAQIINESKQLETTSSVQQPKPITGDAKAAFPIVAQDPGDYVIQFGKFKGQKLSQIEAYDLVSYSEYINDTAIRDGKTITGVVKEFLEKTSEYLDTLDTPQEIPDTAANDLDQFLGRR